MDQGKPVDPHLQVPGIDRISQAPRDDQVGLGVVMRERESVREVVGEAGQPDQERGRGDERPCERIEPPPVR